jgi:hypothetical protein
MQSVELSYQLEVAFPHISWYFFSLLDLEAPFKNITASF